MFNITEAAAYVAGEAHTLWPTNVAPTIASFLNRAGDLAEDHERHHLLTIIPAILDTNEPHFEETSAPLLCHIALTQWAPWALREYGWETQAHTLGQAQDLQEASDLAAQHLNDLALTPRPHGSRRINQAEDLLTNCAFYAGTINAISGVPYQRDPQFKNEITKVRRTSAAIAADILSATTKAKRNAEPHQRPNAGLVASDAVTRILAQAQENPQPG